MKSYHLAAVILAAAVLTGCAQERPPATNADYMSGFMEAKVKAKIPLPAVIPEAWVVMPMAGGVHAREDGSLLGYELLLNPNVVLPEDPVKAIQYCVWSKEDETACSGLEFLPEECVSNPIEERTQDCFYYSKEFPLRITGDGSEDLNLYATVRFRNVDTEVQDFVLARPLTLNWENQKWLERPWEQVTSHDELRHQW